MRSYAAGEGTLPARSLTEPAPVFFAVESGDVLAMIGAVVGEYFGGPQDSLAQRFPLRELFASRRPGRRSSSRASSGSASTPQWPWRSA